MGLCGSGSTDHDSADVSLVRDSRRELTVVAGEKAHIAFQNAKKGLMQFAGKVFPVLIRERLPFCNQCYWP